MTDKKILEDWTAHVKAILGSTSIDTDEPEEQRKERIAALEADPEEWIRYYFPAYAYAEPAPFHLAATKRVIERPEHYEVRMWSRELAKSTRTMMEVLYLTLVGHPPTGLLVDPMGLHNAFERHRKRYVMLTSNSLDNAIRLLMPYRANLEHNQRIIQDYGVQESAGRWQAAEFTTDKGVTFRAIGVGQSPRGTRNEEVRPDILLFDDVDTDVDCLNPQVVAQKWRWIEEAAIGTRSVSHATTIIFCGNRIAVDCCIDRAVKFADHHDVINIRDEHNRSVWPAKNSELDIDRVLLQKSYAAAQKEYYNNPLTEVAVFGKMVYKPVLPVHEYEKLICYTDPSYKATSDFKATVLVGRWKDEYHVLMCFVQQATTAAMLDWHRAIDKYLEGATCDYYMEEVFMQDVILKELNTLCNDNGVRIRIKGDKRAKTNKFNRIETALEPLHRNGRLYFNEAMQMEPNMIRLADQFHVFAPGSSAHDDGPDAVEGAVFLLTDPPAIRSAQDIIINKGSEKRENHF